ncbi:MAG TPA: cupin-like domain-containing protein, partial [Steroidobacter sp.]|nr:cupin-like domain-containing protein [Steroidobacter sp.]
MNPREIAANDLTTADAFVREIAEPCRPVVIRGLVKSWPVVVAAGRSAVHFRDYVARFDAGAVAEAFIGEPHIAGKYYYDDDLAGFNFTRARMRFAEALDRIIATRGEASKPSM